MDNNHKVNIVHYSSANCRRIACSVPSAELYDVCLGFEQGFPIYTAMKNILWFTVKIRIYADSKCLFGAPTALNSTTKSVW